MRPADLTPHERAILKERFGGPMASSVFIPDVPGPPVYVQLVVQDQHAYSNLRNRGLIRRGRSRLTAKGRRMVAMMANDEE